MKVVLVVEDSALSRSFMVAAVGARPDVEVLEACDGAEAWALLQAQPVDLVVSDLNMPGMDGIELTRKIRACPGLAELPVLLCTTVGEMDELLRARDSGISGYVQKPVTSGALNPLLDRLLDGAGG